MSFTKSPNEMVLRTMREFVYTEIVPLERPFLNHDYDTLMPLITEKNAKSQDLGLWLPQIPADRSGWYGPL